MFIFLLSLVSSCTRDTISGGQEMQELVQMEHESRICQFERTSGNFHVHHTPMSNAPTSSCKFDAAQASTLLMVVAIMLLKRV